VSGCGCGSTRSAAPCLHTWSLEGASKRTYFKNYRIYCPSDIVLQSCSFARCESFTPVRGCASPSRVSFSQYSSVYGWLQSGPARGRSAAAYYLLATAADARVGRVGKTSLLLRYVQDTFSENQPATIQASFLTKQTVVDGAAVSLSIWDTAGQERFHALGPIYYRDADGEPCSAAVCSSPARLCRMADAYRAAALLVFDITDADSFARVKSWVKELRQMAGAPAPDASNVDAHGGRRAEHCASACGQQGGPGAESAGDSEGRGGLRCHHRSAAFQHLCQAEPRRGAGVCSDCTEYGLPWPAHFCSADTGCRAFGAGQGHAHFTSGSTAQRCARGNSFVWRWAPTCYSRPRTCLLLSAALQQAAHLPVVKCRPNRGQDPKDRRNRTMPYQIKAQQKKYFRRPAFIQRLLL